VDQFAHVAKNQLPLTAGVDGCKYTSSIVKVCHRDCFIQILPHSVRQGIGIIITASFECPAAIWARIVLATSTPIRVLLLASARRIAPVDVDGMPSRFCINSACVPLPEAGGPNRTIRLFTTANYLWFTNIETATPATANTAKASHIHKRTRSLTTLPAPPATRSKRPRMRPLRKKPS
jgi:hypothetical protein